MRRFGRRKPLFHRPGSDAFRLETEDLEEGAPFWERLFRRHGARRGGFSRYISAGGARDLHGAERQDAGERRSWRRFSVALMVLIVLWMLGAWL